MTTEGAYKEKSKERLANIMKKKVQTTMIGALSSLEEKFGSLWGHEEETVTDEQEQLRNVYEELRSDILDKGNTQIRNIDAELAQYDVRWNRYRYQIPVRPILPTKFTTPDPE
jgi:hypothetical protein